MDIISSLGTLASLMGVGLSIWVLRVATNTNKVLEYRVIGPGSARKIQSFLNIIDPMMGESYDGKNDELHTGMHQCLANLKSLKLHSPKDKTKKIDEVISDIDSMVKLSDYPQETMNGIRYGLVYIIADYSNFQKDLLILK